MAQVKTNREVKVTVVVNVGTTENVQLKNRPIGTGYIANPNAELDKLYQWGQYFGALQAYPISKITREMKYDIVEE